MRTLAIVILSLALASAVASADTFRRTPNLAIPDSSAAGVTDTLTVATSCAMNDVDIELEINHTWIGDLIIKVIHAGTEITLVDRPGRTPQNQTVGCNADLSCARPIVLDDDGGGIEIECTLGCSACFPSGQVPQQSFVPNVPLSGLDTADQAGQWILFVSDNEQVDIGTICAWEVRTTCGPAAVEQATWGSIKARYSK
jgi:subtilisin-like proprotein convertase family protein